ncbi:type III secretion system export apparatus subunit SctS [Acanthopleuribacter pedis]|uniref:Type III secretion system export apparatus subunit SctS n=1 Tax=Acanthopleuribacter pedis TaxID=442870 RepID=A0A8J7QRN8_9BACT|nr:type III secretion system export apparatus subunit SctS [Acanthopleuribacter pedis]MBO1322973.1 type III secretion system export apparatus subunit SctS [Acanthopleuribacter pedis]
MDQATLVELTIHALTLVLLLSLPAVIVASGFGVLVSLLQAVTQVQEQTLSFGVKLIAVVVTLALTARWTGMELFLFMERLLELLPQIGT